VTATNAAAATVAPRLAGDPELLPAVPEDAWRRAEAAIAGARRLLLVCHINPDGDALGSMLGCALGLRSLGYQVQAAFPGPQDLPDVFTQTLRGIDLLVPPEQTYPDPDVLLTFDAASEEPATTFTDPLALHHPLLLVAPPRQPPRWWSTSCCGGWAYRWTPQSPSACTWP